MSPLPTPRARALPAPARPNDAAPSAVARAAQRSVLAVAVAAMLASCVSTPVPNVRRDGDPAAMRRAQAGAAAQDAGGVDVEAIEPDDVGPRPQIRRGTGQVINRSAAGAAAPDLGGTSGAATFNFEGE